MVDQMTAGDSLHVNDELNAANSPVKVVFQEDGNLVLYRTDFQPWKALWTTPTWHKPAREADMQPDGNFVIYNTDVTPHQALWATNTWNHPGSRLVLQDDGNLVIYDPNDHPLWATNTWQPDLPAHWATAPDGTLLAAVGDPAVYVMIGGKRHHVPDPQTFEAEGYDWSNIHWISLEELNNVPLGDPVPHVTRFIIDTGDQHLGRNHYMHTKCGIDLTTGEVAGTTRVWTLTWFGGFHGLVSVIPLDSARLPLATNISQRYGVDGTAIGKSDTGEQAWSAQIDQNKAKDIYHIYCFQTDDPDSFQTDLDKWVQAGKSIESLISTSSGIAKVIAAFGK